MVREGMMISVAILLIMGCAKIFGDYLNMIRVPEQVTNFFMGLHLPNLGMILLIQVLLIIGGMFVDAGSLMVITTPILLPLIKAMGYDPLWYGIVLVINLELAVVTPPVGLNLYTLRSCCPVSHAGRNHQEQLSFSVDPAGLFDFIFDLSAFESVAAESDQIKTFNHRERRGRGEVSKWMIHKDRWFRFRFCMNASAISAPSAVKNFLNKRGPMGPKEACHARIHQTPVSQGRGRRRRMRLAGRPAGDPPREPLPPSPGLPT